MLCACPLRYIRAGGGAGFRIGLKAKKVGLSMNFERISDESVARYYESIRQQAEVDRQHKHHFTASPSVRERADQLRQEMIRRRLQYPPVNWPS